MIAVILQCLTVLCKFGLVLDEAEQFTEADDAEHRKCELLLDFLTGRKRCVFALFLAVQSDDNTRHLRTLSVDDIDGFPDGGAGGDDIIDDQDAALERCADQVATLAMAFGFLAVERHRNIAAAPRKCNGGAGRQRKSLVGRAEQHVEVRAAVEDSRGIGLADLIQAIAVVEQAGVEEIRTDAAGFQGELAEAQHLPADGQLQKLLLVRVHFPHFARAFG